MKSLFLSLLLLLTGAALPAGLRAQDSTRTDDVPGVALGFKFYPEALWSSSAGIGVGVGLEFENLIHPGSELLLTAEPAWHRGLYSASFFTADPYEAPAYGMLGVFYRDDGAYYFFGLGPGSSKDNRVAVEFRALETEARVGLYALDHRLLIQPNVRYHRLDTNDFRDKDPRAFEQMDPESRRMLLFLKGNMDTGFGERWETLDGFSLGMDLAYDRRDDPKLTRKGVLLTLTGRYFVSRQPSDIQFGVYGLGVYGFVPLSARGDVLALRALAMTTDDRSDFPLPFYLLPTLGKSLVTAFSSNRFVGDDLLLLTAEYRRPLFNGFNVMGMEGVVGVSAGNVYDNFFDQFELGLSFDRDMAPGQVRYALRPAVEMGVRLLKFDEVFLTAMLGYSAEGIGLNLTKFIHPLQSRRPKVR